PYAANPPDAESACAARAKEPPSQSRLRRTLRGLRVPAAPGAPAAISGRRADARAPGTDGGPLARRPGDGFRFLGCVPCRARGAPRPRVLAFRPGVLGRGGPEARARAAVERVGADRSATGTARISRRCRDCGAACGGALWPALGRT